MFWGVKMNPRIKSVALDFIFGGSIVAGALLIASFLGPIYGGIIAGAPLRAGSVIFLEYLHNGIDSATRLTRGVLLAMIANVGFSIALYLCMPRLGLYKSFLVAGAVFVLILAPLMKLNL
jgi:hypothetical protein